MIFPTQCILMHWHCPSSGGNNQPAICKFQQGFLKVGKGIRKIVAIVKSSPSFKVTLVNINHSFMIFHGTQQHLFIINLSILFNRVKSFVPCFRGTGFLRGITGYFRIYFSFRVPGFRVFTPFFSSHHFIDFGFGFRYFF